VEENRQQVEDLMRLYGLDLMIEEARRCYDELG
jgi:hypothetical protein